MNKKIYYYQKNVYGNILFYFSKKSAKEQEAFIAISGRKTLTPTDIKALTSLGFKLEETLPE